jgi:fused signal recognition particle receptor
MFNFLKEKLKSAISIFSQKAEKAAEPKDRIEEKPEQAPPAKELPEKVQPKLKASKMPPKIEPAQELEKPKPETKFEAQPEKPRAETSIETAKLQAEPSMEAMPELEQQEEIPVPKPEKHGLFKKLKEKFKKPEEQEEPKIPKVAEERQIEIPEPAQKGFFAKLKEKVQTITISEDKFNELFWDLEVVLLENNVAVEVIEKMKSDLREGLVDKPIPRGRIFEAIQKALTQSIRELFQGTTIDILQEAKKKKPYVICFVGVNGSGKTTTIAKVAYLFKQHNMSCVLAAADTFRAAAIDQLELHAQRLGVKLIKHDYGSDSAAVAFDAIKHAESKNRDVVLIDTAGRMHSNANLMDEMKKVVRVAKPDLVLFIGEAITGNDCVEQARMFNEAVKIDGIILSKADVDEKGGAAISISRVTNKPILFLGTGQNYEDLKPFDSNFVIESLGLSA